METPDDQARARAQEKQSQEHEADDLVAQQQAADAATVSANWNTYAVVWAAVGSLATIGASILAFLAWTNSAKSLKVATQGQRAHLLIEDTLGGNCFGYPPRQQQPVFCFKIANHGQSPAWITGLEIRTITGELPGDPPVMAFDERRVIVMAPNTTTDHFMEDLDLSEGFKWDHDLYVVGAIRYRDIYAERHGTFLFKLLLHGGAKNQDIMVPWGDHRWWKYD